MRESLHAAERDIRDYLDEHDLFIVFLRQRGSILQEIKLGDSGDTLSS